MHRVEATSRLSPLPAGVTATSSAGPSTPLGRATADECTVYSHDEETFGESTLEERTAFDRRLETFEEQRDSVDDVEMYSSGEETFSESTLEERTAFDQRVETFEERRDSVDRGVEALEEEIVKEVAVDQKSAFVGATARRRLDVPDVDDVEMYSSGEESMDRWTVETYRLYEVTRNVEADVILARARQRRAAAAAAVAAAVDSSHGTARTRTLHFA